MFGAAKKDATRIYLPLLVVTNLMYAALLLRFGTTANSSTLGILGAIVTWIEQAYSYVGILDHASINAGGGGGGGNSKSKSKDLAGGSSLDLLAVTLLVQFGSVLHSTRWLWLTVVGVPVMAAYKLYQAVYGGSGKRSDSDSNNNSNNNSATKNKTKDDTNGDDPLAAKRQRRAEKRRQKRG